MFILENLTQLNILKEIWINQTFTRTQIKDTLNINKSTVTRNFDSMMQQNMFFEEGAILPGEQGGRKTQIFRFNKDLVYFISIAALNGELLVLLENISGEAICKIDKKIKINSDSELINALEEVIEEIKKCKPEIFEKVISINIAVPGIVDSYNGIIKYSSDLNIHELNLKQYLEEKYSRYVLVENDANAAAALSLYKSKFTDINLIYFLFFLPKNLLSLGGIGAGIVINNILYKGTYSAAGEVRIKNYWMFSNNSEIDTFKIETADESSLMENEDFKNYINNFSERIAGVIHFIDPKKVILGGDIKNFSNYLRDYTVKKIETYYSSGLGDNFVQIDFGGLESVAKGSTISFLISFMNDLEFAKSILK